MGGNPENPEKTHDSRQSFDELFPRAIRCSIPMPSVVGGRRSDTGCFFNPDVNQLQTRHVHVTHIRKNDTFVSRLPGTSVFDKQFVNFIPLNQAARNSVTRLHTNRPFYTIRFSPYHCHSCVWNFLYAGLFVTMIGWSMLQHAL